MKLYYHSDSDSDHVYFFTFPDNAKLPLQVDVTCEAGAVVGEISESTVIYESLIDALQAQADSFAEKLNEEAVSGVNVFLANGQYRSARMRDKYTGAVGAVLTDSDKFLLAVKKSKVENDLISDERFTCTLFLKDVSYIADYLVKSVRKVSGFSGNGFKRVLRAFYAGASGEELRTIDKLPIEPGKEEAVQHSHEFENYNITSERMEFLRGCVKTTHALKADVFGHSIDKRRFVNVLLSDDEDILRQKESKKG